MRLIFSVILLALSCAAAQAQQLRALSLQPTSDLPNGKLSRQDFNGVPAAIVKVMLPVEGVRFDGNLIGEPMFDVNQYYVWLEGYREGVSPGTREFDIQCPGVETLRVTFADISDITLLSPGAIYELRLDVPDELRFARSSGPKDAGGNYFALSVTPKSNLTVRVDGQLVETDKGEATVFCRYGDHTYSVEAPGYMAENGSFTITKGGDKVVRDISLRSSKASVTITAATPGTVISLNGQRRGEGSWSGTLGAGTYQLEGSLAGHEPYRASFDLSESESRTVEIPALTPIYARLDVTCKPNGADITIDGRHAGTTPQVFTDLLEGPHEVSISKAGYQDIRKIVTLSASQPCVLSETMKEDITADTRAVGVISGNTGSDKIFESVEQQAQFPGGKTALLKWLSSNLRYPEAAQQNNIQGRVLVKFIIEKDGTVADPVIIHGVDPDLDKEAIRVIRSMPRWEPGKNNGVPARSYFTIPIGFKLQQ